MKLALTKMQPFKLRGYLSISNNRNSRVLRLPTQAVEEVKLALSTEQGVQEIVCGGGGEAGSFRGAEQAAAALVLPALVSDFYYFLKLRD